MNSYEKQAYDQPSSVLTPYSQPVDLISDRSSGDTPTAVPVQAVIGAALAIKFSASDNGLGQLGQLSSRVACALL